MIASFFIFIANIYFVIFANAFMKKHSKPNCLLLIMAFDACFMFGFVCCVFVSSISIANIAANCVLTILFLIQNEWLINGIKEINKRNYAEVKRRGE
jgi:hypothetical protein